MVDGAVAVLWSLFAAWSVSASAINNNGWLTVAGVMAYYGLLVVAATTRMNSDRNQETGRNDEGDRSSFWRGSERDSGRVMACALLPALFQSLCVVIMETATTEEATPVEEPVLLASLVLISFGCLLFALVVQKVEGEVTQGRHRRKLWQSAGVVALVAATPCAVGVDGESGLVALVVGSVYAACFLGLFEGCRTAALRHVFTFGEWTLVVSLLSLLSTHHFWVLFRGQSAGELHSSSLVFLVARSGFLGAFSVPALVRYGWQRVFATKKSYRSVGVCLALSVVLIVAWMELNLYLFCRRQLPYHEDRTIHLVVPQCLVWLLEFLSDSEKSCFLSADMEIPVPRYVWLLYWAVILVATVPWIPQPASSASSVTLTRKWFHAVAVSLFLPVTLCAPQLQALAYAVAISLLVGIEGLQLRQDVPQLHNALFASYCDPRKHESDNNNNKVIVSHMALIAGCAMPLYLALYLLETLPAAILTMPKLVVFCRALSLVGIVGLGVGDAMAAVMGTLYSRWEKKSTTTIQWEARLGLSCWGRENRTWLGSLAMLLSMLMFAWIMDTSLFPSRNEHAVLWWQLWTKPLLWLTVVEAYTSQLDNLVLPLVGMTAFLVQYRNYVVSR